MPKFVWEITSRGTWAPQLFHGELPREMMARENVHRYRVHNFDVLRPGTTLDQLAEQFPAPAPEAREIRTVLTTEYIYIWEQNAMSIKSILRRLWDRRSIWAGTDLADVVRGVTPQPTPFLDRLTSRRDWDTRHGMVPADPTEIDGPGSEYVPRPVHKPFLTHMAPPSGPVQSAGLGLPFPPAPGQGTMQDYAARVNANTARLNHKPDPWPPNDDPYTKPEPCPVVPDAGLERVRKLTERGLISPVGSKSTLSQIMDLIDRQEDAEKYLRNIGMVWEKGRGWYFP